MPMIRSQISEFLIVHQLSRKSSGEKKSPCQNSHFGAEYSASNALFLMSLSSSSFWLCSSNLNVNEENGVFQDGKSIAGILPFLIELYLTNSSYSFSSPLKKNKLFVFHFLSVFQSSSILVLYFLLLFCLL